MLVVSHLRVAEAIIANEAVGLYRHCDVRHRERALLQRTHLFNSTNFLTKDGHLPRQARDKHKVNSVRRHEGAGGCTVLTPSTNNLSARWLFSTPNAAAHAGTIGSTSAAVGSPACPVGYFVPRTTGKKTAAKRSFFRVFPIFVPSLSW